MKKYILPVMFALACTLTSCDDVFVPAPENNLPLDFLENNSTYAQNLLGNAYMYMPNSGGFAYNEPATDDAVSNDVDNSWRIIASGRWTAQNNPVNRWDGCRMAIQYCNLFLENLPRVTWAKDEVVNQLFAERFEAEARALRAIHMFYLLQAHAGVDNAGNLLGVPIVEVSEGEGSNFNVPRNTFVECMQAMKRDAEAALKVLPAKYGPESFDGVRQRHPGVTEGQLERVYGDKMTGRVSGMIVEAFLARMALMAASPAFAASGCTWEQAADENAHMVAYAGGIAGLDPTGGTWYCDPNIEKFGDTESPAEVIWRGERGNSATLEEDNFPPTLYGKGRINPTQNLVDAFPMLNGYPVSDPRANYNAQNPYADRDPRLAQYILYN